MHPKRTAAAAAIAICVANQASGQECPQASATEASIPSQVRTLEGLLVFHDGIRQWIELKLDKPACGQSSIQLMAIKANAPALGVFAGCRVKSTGLMDLAPTGYYTLDIFQDVERIDPAEGCLKKPPLPDYTMFKPDKGVRSYRVDMDVNYRRGDHPIKFRVTSAGKELRPWQAYANYLLTGGFVLYGHCGEGFVIDKVFGTPEATPTHFDDPRTPADMAEFDPESAAQSGKRDLHLGYYCIREQ